MVSWTKSSTSSLNCSEFTPAEEVGALERVSAVYSSFSNVFNGVTEPGESQSEA